MSTTPDGPRHLSSSSPAVTLGPQKAIVAAIAGAVVAGGTALISAVSDGAIDVGEAWTIVGAILAGAGLTGGSTYAKSTDVTIR